MDMHSETNDNNKKQKGVVEKRAMSGSPLLSSMTKKKSVTQRMCRTNGNIAAKLDRTTQKDILQTADMYVFVLSEKLPNAKFTKINTRICYMNSKSF